MSSPISAKEVLEVLEMSGQALGMLFAPLLPGNALSIREREHGLWALAFGNLDE